MEPIKFRIGFYTVGEGKVNLLYRAGFMHEMTDKAGEMTDKQVEELKFGKIPYRNCEDVKRGQKCPQSTWDNKGTVT